MRSVVVRSQMFFFSFFFLTLQVEGTEGSFFSMFILRVPFPHVKCCLVFLFCLYFQNPRVVKGFLYGLSNFTHTWEALCVNIAQKDSA